jgi:hypothetical protein
MQSWNFVLNSQLLRSVFETMLVILKIQGVMVTTMIAPSFVTQSNSILAWLYAARVSLYSFEWHFLSSHFRQFGSIK